MRVERERWEVSDRCCRGCRTTGRRVARLFVWVLSVSHQVALDRLQENRGLSADESEKRIVAQQPRRGIGNLNDEVEAHVVTAVIDNNGSLEDLKQRLAEKLQDPSAWYSRTFQPLPYRWRQTATEYIVLLFLKTFL